MKQAVSELNITTQHKNDIDTTNLKRIIHAWVYLAIRKRRIEREREIGQWEGEKSEWMIEREKS